MIAAYRSGGKLPSTKALSKKIQDLTAAPAPAKARRTRKVGQRQTRSQAVRCLRRRDWTEYEKLAMIKAQASGQDVLHVMVKIDPHCAMPIAGRQLVQNAIGTMGPVLAVRPDAKSPAATKQIEFVLASMQTVEQIAAKCKIPDHRRRSHRRNLIHGHRGHAARRRYSTAPKRTDCADR